MTISELKKAIKKAEKARNEWDGRGEIPVSYDALCELRSQLTALVIEAQDAARQEERKQADDKRFWDGIWSRVEVAQ